MCSMQIPRKIKIGAHNYDIVIAKPNELGNDRDGYHDPANNQIIINGEYGHSHQLATFWHESLHALNSELEEKDVEFIAQGITQIIIDNNL